MGEQVAARFYGGLAQLGEHLPCKQGVESSNLLVSILDGSIFRSKKKKNMLWAYSSAG